MKVSSHPALLVQPLNSLLANVPLTTVLSERCAPNIELYASFCPLISCIGE
jgi:hypothetical protein